MADAAVTKTESTTLERFAPVKQLISEQLLLSDTVGDFLGPFREHGDDYRTTCVCGSQGPGRALLASDLFGGKAITGGRRHHRTQERPLSKAAKEAGSFRGIWLRRADEDRHLVLELEGFDSTSPTFSDRERSMAKFGVLLAQTVVYVLEYSEVLDEMSARTAESHLSQLVTLFNTSNQFAPSLPRMGLIIVVLNRRTARYHNEAEMVKRRILESIERAISPPLQGFSSNVSHFVNCVCCILHPRNETKPYNREIRKLASIIHNIERSAMKPATLNLVTKLTNRRSSMASSDSTPSSADGQHISLEDLPAYMSLIWTAISKNVTPALSHIRECILNQRGDFNIDINQKRGLRDVAFRRCMEELQREEHGVVAGGDTTRRHSVHVSRAVKYFLQLSHMQGDGADPMEIESLIKDLATKVARIHSRRSRNCLSLANKKCLPLLKRANRCLETMGNDWTPEHWLEMASQLRIWQRQFLVSLVQNKGEAIGLLLVSLNSENTLSIELEDPCNPTVTIVQQMMMAAADTFKRPWDAARRVILSRFSDHLDAHTPRARKRILKRIRTPQMTSLLGSAPSDLVRAARSVYKVFGRVLAEYGMLRNIRCPFEQILAEVIRNYNNSFQDERLQPYLLFIHRWQYVCTNIESFPTLKPSLYDAWKHTLTEMVPLLLAIGEGIAALGTHYGLTAESSLGLGICFAYSPEQIVEGARFAKDLSITGMVSSHVDWEMTDEDLAAMEQATTRASLLPPEVIDTSATSRRAVKAYGTPMLSKRLPSSRLTTTLPLTARSSEELDS